MTTARAVVYDRYGGPEVLRVAEVPVPEPGHGEAVVAVRTAAVNLFETIIRSGALKERFPPNFPSREGTDLAGVVHTIGAGVTGVAVGDEVIGWSPTFASHTTHALVPARELVAKPANLSWDIAGSMQMLGATAFAAVRAVDPQPGETVAVSAAAGGIGTFLVQYLVHRGVRVIGIASAANADWLHAHGVTPVPYGAGLRERLVETTGPSGVAAFLDLFGPEYLELAVALGVPVDRINTIAAMPQALEIGAKIEGRHNAATPEVLAEMTDLVARGIIEVPIVSTYPLDRIADAYVELEKRHSRGKIVVHF